MKRVPEEWAPAGVTAPSAPVPPERQSAMAAAGTIHDLGNLIQLATSALGILGRSPDLRGAQVMPVIASARSSLERAGSLVRDALGQPRPEKPLASLAGCLVEIEAQMRSAAQSGVALDIRLEPGLPALACDPLGLQCAMLNLLFNARDAMAGQGVIEVTGRRSGAGIVELRIADHGIGMAPETIARALDPFFTTKCDGLGGIGLPMVERFVRAAGGELLIESEPGAGTAVTMRLPAVPQGPMK